MISRRDSLLFNPSMLISVVRALAARICVCFFAKVLHCDLSGSY